MNNEFFFLLDDVMIVGGLLLILFVGEWLWGLVLMLIGILLHVFEVGFTA